MSIIKSIKVNHNWKISCIGCRSILMKAMSDAGNTTNNVTMMPMNPNNSVICLSNQSLIIYVIPSVAHWVSFLIRY
jgi:hypothetical protein